MIATYSHHVVTLHIWLILVFALIVELPEEVEGHHSVEIDHNRQQADRQHQLKRNTDVNQKKCHFQLPGVETH